MHQYYTQDKLVDPASVTTLFKISDTIGCCATGMAPDARSQVQKARQECVDFTNDFAYSIPPGYLAGRMADQNQVYTQHAYMRPMGVGAGICACKPWFAYLTYLRAECQPSPLLGLTRSTVHSYTSATLQAFTLGTKLARLELRRMKP